MLCVALFIACDANSISASFPCLCDANGATQIDLFLLVLAKDQVHHDRTKHIDVRYHFLRSEKRIVVKKVGTADNPADMFTKPVPVRKFKHCLDLLNVDSHI